MVVVLSHWLHFRLTFWRVPLPPWGVCVCNYHAVKWCKLLVGLSIATSANSLWHFLISRLGFPSQAPQISAIEVFPCFWWGNCFQFHKVFLLLGDWRQWHGKSLIKKWTIIEENGKSLISAKIKNHFLIISVRVCHSHNALRLLQRKLIASAEVLAMERLRSCQVNESEI